MGPARSGCATYRSAAGRSCWPGASGSGAVMKPACEVRTWTERVTTIGPRVVLAQRPGPRPAGASARTPMRSPRSPVTWGLAGRPPCGRWLTTAPRWWTTHAPGRCRQAGAGRESFLNATRAVPTRWVTGLVDLEVTGCWMWWPTAAGPRWTASSALGPMTGWPASARSPWTPGAGMPGPWSLRLATPGWSWITFMPSG
jgi:hypothetical protein